MTYELRKQRRVEFHETDAAGTVFFGNYFRWMDEMEGEFFRSFHLPGPLIKHWGATGEGGYNWSIVKVTCEYVRPVLFDDLLDIHLWVKRKGAKSLTLAFVFSRRGEEVAQGEKISCCVQGPKGQQKSVPIPDYISELIEPAPWADGR